MVRVAAEGGRAGNFPAIIMTEMSRKIEMRWLLGLSRQLHPNFLGKVQDFRASGSLA